MPMVMKTQPVSGKSIVIVVRDNDGNDSSYTVTSTKEASAVAKTHAISSNHMICFEVDGERTDRWDRDRVVGQNKWRRVYTDEMETLGKIREIVVSG